MHRRTYERDSHFAADRSFGHSLPGRETRFVSPYHRIIDPAGLRFCLDDLDDLTYYSLEHSILVRQTKRARLDEARRRIDMLLLPLAGEGPKVVARRPYDPRGR